MRKLVLLTIVAILSLSLLAATVSPSSEEQIDELSGLSFGDLLQGNIPDEPFWEFIRPQREYLKKTYGEAISTTYELFLKEKNRSPAGEPGTDEPRLLEVKSIARWPDPVVLVGGKLPGWTGRRLGDLRLYALRLGKFLPIPYQFDEVTEDGRKVLPDGGPEANPQDGNGLLDPPDEFIFMAHDLGDRTRPRDWMQGLQDVLEIAVKDPLDKSEGWCYLLQFESGQAPEPSPLDYSSYNEKYNQHYDFYVFEQSMFGLFKGKLYRQIFNQKWQMPDYAGGNFKNFIDRLKYRVRVRLLFGSVKISTTESDFSGDTLALRDGAVRCNRRCWGQVRLPLGLKTPRIVADIIGLDTMFICPLKLSVPFNPGIMLTDLTLYSGTDLNENAIGSRWYNSNNLGGLPVDGKPMADEQKMDDGRDQWRLVTGAWGTMMNRSIWDPSFVEQATIKIRFTDDAALGDPPEYVPGQIGMAYNDSTVKNLKAGIYQTELDWFFIPQFNTPENTGKLNLDWVNAYLNMYSHPVLVSAGQGWFSNVPRPMGIREEIREELGQKALELQAEESPTGQ